MDNGIFRKKSIEKVSTPDQLNEYIHIATPKVWLVLSAVIILLVGALMFFMFVNMAVDFDAVVVCNDNRCICYLPEETLGRTKEGNEISVGNKNGKITNASTEKTRLDNNTEFDILDKGNFSIGDNCYMAEAEIPDLPNGVYKAKITSENIRLINFFIQGVNYEE